jgi:hypothetical protein
LLIFIIILLGSRGGYSLSFPTKSSIESLVIWGGGIPLSSSSPHVSILCHLLMSLIGLITVLWWA